MDNLPFVSIVIPVYNGESTLALCLNSIKNLNYPKDKLEIIVVDNNSTDGSKEIIQRYPVKYLLEEILGPAAARNKGIKEAKGEIIAFTDADCIVDENWVINGVGGFDEKEIGICGGKIAALSSRTLVERYSVATEKVLDQERAALRPPHPLPYLITANAMYRRDVLLKAGSFDEDLIAGEDVDLGWRVQRAGYRIKYIPQAIVFHRHRKTIVDLYRQFFKYGYGVSSLIKKHRQKYGEISLIDKYSLSQLYTSLKRFIFYNDGLTKNNSYHRFFHLLDMVVVLASLAGRLYGLLENRVPLHCPTEK